ncbi:n-alpha-acetyltransferase 15, NatA auxiliary subunit-like protein [Chytridium lagenaria]|nr:n-alpha-acetyltransferase 15, NatA auxiliary subunit-like protein [Chytridium lagenaria]
MTTTVKKDLPSKEAALMKAILKYHENKQYKKGMKTADQILKKFPDHGETVAMKALFLSSLERKEEAHDLIKKALRLEISNPVCWHVYGLIHRSERNYEEALKSYSQAIRFEKDNLQIYRDHAMLMIHLRNYDGFVEANLGLIKLRPNLKSFWLSVAVAFYLTKSYQFALETLKHYHDSFQTIVEPNSAYENSEVYLFKNLILEEMGSLKEAMDHLNSVEKIVVDKKAWKETKARLLLKMGENKKAEAAYKALVKMNPDCEQYLRDLLKAKGFEGELSEDQRTKVLELFEDLGDEFKKAHIIRRLPLEFAKGERFTLMTNSYLKPLFRKGVPSVFVSIRDLYKAVEDLVLGYSKNLKEHGRFSADDEGAIEPPSALLWVLYFLAQHFDFTKHAEKALKYIDEAIDHTPTLVELLMTKARILKHHGDTAGAMKVMNEARERDLQDRFINSKCTKYMLRNDAVEQAEKTIVLFCRSDSSDKLADLAELQCMWFPLETGRSYVRQGKYGKALKRYHQIEKHFSDIYDDQFDFHNYSFRRVTLTTYLDLLKMEDRLRSHPLFFQAAVEAVRIYIKLADRAKEEEAEKENINASDLSDSDKKKALRKLKKDTPTPAVNGTDKPNAVAANGKKVDTDPDGQKLLETTDPLKDSLKFLKPLLELSPNAFETHELASAVYLRKKKFLLAWKSLRKGYSLKPKNYELHKTAVEFWKEFHAASSQLNPKVVSLITSTLSDVYGDSKDVTVFNTKFAEKNAGSLPHMLASVETTSALDRLKRTKAVNDFVAKLEVSGTKAWKSITLDNLIAAHKSLSSNASLASPDAAAKLAQKALVAYPLSTYFKSL